MNYFKHVFECQRLKIQSVRGVVVGGDCFGVAVNHYRFDTYVTKREGCVNTAVVKLNTLTNTVRPTAKNDDLFLVRRHDFGELLVGAVVVRGLRWKLTCTGIHGFEYWSESETVS